MSLAGGSEHAKGTMGFRYACAQGIMGRGLWLTAHGSRTLLGNDVCLGCM